MGGYTPRFAFSKMDESSLGRLLMEVESARTELRFIHLSQHFKTGNHPVHRLRIGLDPLRYAGSAPSPSVFPIEPLGPIVVSVSVQEHPLYCKETP